MNSGIRRKKLPSGKRHYYVYAEIDGREQGFGGFPLKRDAEARLRRLRSELASGTLGTGKELFGSFAQRWLEEHVAITVKQRTYRDYQSVLQNHLVPALGKVPVNKIRYDTCQKLIAAKTKSGLTPRTVSKILTVLRMVLKAAVRWGLITVNPAAEVIGPRQVHHEMDFLTPEEVNRLLDACTERAYPIFATAVLAGLRQGELLALRVGDVDLERGVIFVRRSWQQESGESEPKTRAGRRAVRIGENLIEILSRHITTDRALEDLLFPSQAGTHINHANLISREFHPALKAAGLRHIRFHDLRHTYAAMMISLGCNMKFLQQQLGHAKVSTTMDLYGHLLPGVDEGIEKRLDALVFNPKVIPFPRAAGPSD